MNFLEAMEILRTLSRFRSGNSNERPKLVILNAERESYTIWVNQKKVKMEHLRSFEGSAKTP